MSFKKLLLLVLIVNVSLQQLDKGSCDKCTDCNGADGRCEGDSSGLDNCRVSRQAKGAQRCIECDEGYGLFGSPTSTSADEDFKCYPLTIKNAQEGNFVFTPPKTEVVTRCMPGYEIGTSSTCIGLVNSDQQRPIKHCISYSTSGNYPCDACNGTKVLTNPSSDNNGAYSSMPIGFTGMFSDNMVSCVDSSIINVKGVAGGNQYNQVRNKVFVTGTCNAALNFTVSEIKVQGWESGSWNTQPVICSSPELGSVGSGKDGSYKPIFSVMFSLALIILYFN